MARGLMACTSVGNAPHNRNGTSVSSQERCEKEMIWEKGRT